MSSTAEWSDGWMDRVIACDDCGWSGPGRATVVGEVSEVPARQEQRCPSCFELLLVVHGAPGDGPTASAVDSSCLLCTPDRAAEEFSRRTVWTDGLWRLSLVEDGSPVAGFGHLEPIRHIPSITELDGAEAATLGPVLAAVTAALRAATGAERVYVYVFGERVAHLHLNLAPHTTGDALVGGPGLVRDGTEPVPAGKLRRVTSAVEALLRDIPR